jgi:hypothetical protein
MIFEVYNRGGSLIRRVSRRRIGVVTRGDSAGDEDEVHGHTGENHTHTLCCSSPVLVAVPNTTASAPHRQSPSSINRSHRHSPYLHKRPPFILNHSHPHTFTINISLNLNKWTMSAPARKITVVGIRRMRNLEWTKYYL